MQAPSPDELARADRAACARAIRTGSRSFFAASLLLPPSVRPHALALYAFCRQADDAVDRGGSGDRAIARLAERLDRACRGRPLPLAADRALAATVARFAIPPALPEALLEGFAWDADGRRYHELAELRAYAVRVAGSVGVMMALLMRTRAPAALARACDLGVAMQLTNIARDVGEDARAGRLYLPLAWLAQAGIDAQAWLARPAMSPALASVVARLLAVADRLYERASAGIRWLPWSCRPAIRAACLLYAEIGREVERRAFDSVSTRAVVPRERKVRLLSRALLPHPGLPHPGLPHPGLSHPGLSHPGLSAPGGGREAAADPLPEARWLLDAVAAAPAPAPRAWDERASWVIDLFCELERRERARRPAYPPWAERSAPRPRHAEG